jgi:hypothetical protein
MPMIVLEKGKEKMKRNKIVMIIDGTNPMFVTVVIITITIVTIIITITITIIVTLIIVIVTIIVLFPESIPAIIVVLTLKEKRDAQL